MRRFAFVLFLLVASAAFAQQEPARHVVLISIDGMMPRYYTHADELGLRIPNLRKLMREGVYAEGVIGVLPSVTYPSHTTIISGVTPRDHGVLSNRVFDPPGTSFDAWNWFADIIEVPTLISAAEARFMTTGAIAWPASIGSGADYNVPEFWRPGSNHEIDRKFLAMASNPPGILRSLENANGRPFGPPVLTDDDRTGAANFIIRAYKPEVMLLHIIEVDTAEHSYGPMTPEAFAAMEKSDRMLGKVLETIQAAGIADRTLVAVVSDHGFLAVRTQIKPNTLLREAGLIDVDAKGKVTGYRAWFHNDAGSTALHASDPAVVERVRTLIRQKMAAGESGIEAIIDQERAHKLGSRAPLVLDAKEGYYFSDSVEGQWTAPGTTKGVHGFDPERPALHASLIMTGPFKRRGSLGIVPMTSIAPTLADYLGLTLSPRAGAGIELGGRSR